jgi:methionyl-tRNA synthetase
MATILANGIPAWAVALALVWVLPWKGIALWKSARLSHKKWFIVLLIVNTFGILDIVYIYFVAKKYTVETIESK